MGTFRAALPLIPVKPSLQKLSPPESVELFTLCCSSVKYQLFSRTVKIGHIQHTVFFPEYLHFFISKVYGKYLRKENALLKYMIFFKLPLLCMAEKFLQPLFRSLLRLQLLNSSWQNIYNRVKIPRFIIQSEEYKGEFAKDQRNTDAVRKAVNYVSWTDGYVCEHTALTTKILVRKKNQNKPPKFVQFYQATEINNLSLPQYFALQNLA